MQYEPTRNILLLILDFRLAPDQPQMAQGMIHVPYMDRLRFLLFNPAYRLLILDFCLTPDRLQMAPRV
jgi:hypothetical protein